MRDAINALVKNGLAQARTSISQPNRSVFYELVCILCLGLLAVTWFHGLLINTSDFAFPLDRLRYFLSTLSWWDDRGFANPLQLPNLLFGVSSVLSQYGGISVVDYERILFYSWFAGAGVSAYLLARTLGLGRVGRLSASVFYMMNPLSLILIWSIGQGIIESLYAFMPAVIGLFLHGIVKRRGVRYVFGTQLMWLGFGLLGPAANVQLNLVYWVTIFAIVAPLCLARFALHDVSGLRHVIKFTTLSVFSFATLNLFWLLPTLSQVGQYFQLYSGFAKTAFVPNLAVYKQNSFQLADALRLMGYWAFPAGGWQGGLYYPWGAFYSSTVLTIITFLPLTMIVVGLRRLTRRLLLLIPPYFLGLFFIAGVNPPLGWLKESIFVNFALFQSTRNVGVSWGLIVALCSAPLFGFGLELVYTKIGKLGRWPKITALTRGTLVFGIVFLVIGVLAFPFWTGAIIQSGVGNLPAVDQTFQAPPYYEQFKTYIDSQPGDFKVLSLPLSLSGNGFYNWQHGYIGPDPLFWFSNHPVLYYNNLSPMYDFLARGFAEQPIPSSSLAVAMAMMNVRYVVVHGDAEWRLIDSYEPSYYHVTQDILKQALNAPEFKYIGDIGQLSIYLNTVDIGHVYASIDPMILNDTFDGLRNVLPLGILKQNSTVITTNIPADFQSDFASLTQVLKLDQNGADFFVPATSTSKIYVNSPEDLTQVFIDGTPWNLTGTQLNLIPISRITTCFPGGCRNSTAVENHAAFAVNLANGDQSINFEFQPFNFTNHSIQILMDGDGSGNKIAFQLYDQSGNFVGWNRVLDWSGAKLLDLSLNSYDYYSSDPAPNRFQTSQGKLLSIHYLPNGQQAGQTTVIIRVIHPSSPADNPWSSISGLSLTRGWHTLKIPQGQIGYGELVIASGQGAGQISSRPPSVNFERLSATEYRVRVVNATSPFYLVFSETYDPGWKLYGSDLSMVHALSTPTVQESHHFMANGFANAWYLNKTGTYSLTIYYYPQSIYEVSLMLTFVALLFTLVVVVDRHQRVISLLTRHQNKQPVP